MEVHPTQGSARIEHIPMTKARSMIGKLINRVHVDKEHIVLEKSGMPVVALIDMTNSSNFSLSERRAICASRLRKTMSWS